MSVAVLDVNVLVYLIDADSKAHDACRSWLNDARAADWDLVLPDAVIVGALRVLGLPSYAGAEGTRAGAAWIDQLLALPRVQRVAAKSGAFAWFRALIDELSLSGNDVPDAYLAGIALDLHASLASTDRGFERFSALTLIDPTRGAPGSA